jgi:hypothetical protein
MSYRYLTANIPNASTNTKINVNWDISANNLDASLNLRTVNIAPSGPIPARSDVSYNFSVIHLAGNTINRSTYIPNPYNGKMAFTTSNNNFSVWNASSSLWWNFSLNLTSGYLVTASAGSAYVPSPVYLASDGSTIISGPISGSYTIIAFTSVASVTTYTFTPLFTGNIQYVIVAGGGGGGEGGGGAGGLLTNTSYSVTSGTGYSVSVGAGGVGCTSSVAGISPSIQSPGTNGGNSVFNGITAVGGGAGGCEITVPGAAAGKGNSGGSGGGCRRDGNGSVYPAYASGNPGVNTGTPGQGNAGGNTQGSATWTGGGGGGGAGATGGYGLSGGFGTAPGGGPSGTQITEAGGVGGIGSTATSIIPVSAASALNVGQIYTPPPIGPVLPPEVYFSGGGGGCCESNTSPAPGGGLGGTGGGGAGAKGSMSSNGGPGPYTNPNPLPTPGTANTGGGGGGVAAVNSNGVSAGNGGSGVIIIRFTN